MKPAGDVKTRDAPGETGTQPVLTTETLTVAAGARHPTLNTKPLFKLMVERKASDLFFTSNAPIKIKIEGQILPVNKQVLTPETVRQTAFAHHDPGAARALPEASGSSTSLSPSPGSGASASTSSCSAAIRPW